MTPGVVVVKDLDGDSAVNIAAAALANPALTSFSISGGMCQHMFRFTGSTIFCTSIRILSLYLCFPTRYLQSSSCAQPGLGMPSQPALRNCLSRTGQYLRALFQARACVP